MTIEGENDHHLEVSKVWTDPFSDPFFDPFSFSSRASQFVGQLTFGVETAIAGGAAYNAINKAVTYDGMFGAAETGMAESVPMGFDSIKAYQQAWGEMAAAERAVALQQAVPVGSSGRPTMGAGAYWDANGVPQIAISSSEPGTYLRPGVTPLPGEVVIGGVGHAETKLLNSGLDPFAIGAGRPVCPTCQPPLDNAGVIIVTPRK